MNIELLTLTHDRSGHALAAKSSRNDALISGKVLCAVARVNAGGRCLDRRGGKSLSLVARR
jgi:hypothetical protein